MTVQYIHVYQKWKMLLNSTGKLQTTNAYLVKNNGHYEVIKGKSLSQVGIIKVKEKHSQDQQHVLT